MRLIVEALACGLLLPGALGAVGLLQSEVCGQRGRPRCQWLLGNLTLALAFWAGFAALRFAPLWPQLPLWHWHWIGYWGLLAAGVGLVASAIAEKRFWVRGGFWVRRALDIALALVVAALVLPPSPNLEPVRVGWFLVIAAAIPLVSWSFESQCRRWPGGRVPFCLGLTVVVAGAVVGGLWGSAKFAQELGVLGAGVGAWWLIRLRRGGQVPSHGTTLTIAVLLVLLLIESDIFTWYEAFGPIPRTSALLLMAAPSAAWLGAIPAISRWGERPALACQVAATVVVLALAAFLA